MKWHSFRKRRTKIIVPILSHFKKLNKKTIGTDFLFIHIIEEGFDHGLMPKKSHDKAGKFLFDKLIKDQNFIKKRLEKYREKSLKFVDFFRNKMSGDLSKYTNEKILDSLEQYYKHYQELALLSIPVYMCLSDYLSDYLLKKLGHFSKERANKIVLTLSTPNYQTYTKKEEVDLISFAINIKERQMTKFEETKEFKELVKKYFWIPFDYYGPEVWDKKYYIKKINKLLERDIAELKRKKDKILEYYLILKEKQTQLTKEQKFSNKLIDLFDVLKSIALIQDEKKAVTTESHYYLQRVFKELSKRTNMHYFDFYLLLPNETKDVLLKSVKLKRLVEERKKLSILIIKNGKEKVITGNNARRYAKNNKFLLVSQEQKKTIDEIKGTIGSLGRAKGKVKVIDNQKEMHKFKRGEILVSTMTSPDYSIIMSKAKAIVTNEGGMTCHAAIVSRELGIPCVIGTKIATKVLKDGDLVEVNANEGIVKIIKRK